MAARPRYRRYKGLPAITMVAALLLHGAIVGTVELLRETPLPKVFVQLSGEGQGSISSEPNGLACGPDSQKCDLEVEPGTVVTLRALREEGSTFEGWTGCEKDDRWALECRVKVDKSVHVVASFGKVPEKIDLAVEDEKTTPKIPDIPVVVALPDPDAEFAKLDVPLPPPPKPVPPPELAQLQPPEIKPIGPAPPQIPKPQPPPEPTAAKPKKKQPPPPKQMKAVEVPDENEVKEAPDDATFLSDKNRNVVEQTRATDTNLEKQQSGKTSFSEKSNVDSQDVGSDEEKIAQAEKVEETSLDAKRVAESETRGNTKDGMVPRGEAGDAGDEGDNGDGSKADKPGVLAMRGINGRGAPGGPVLDRERTGSSPGKAGKRGDKGRRGIKTNLDFTDYRRIVGTEVADREVELGKKRQSKRLGRFERKQQAVRAALENFIPEVHPGNQTALKTRKAPFALYVARMHRRIHELWGFGFLEELDSRPATDPLNNFKLQTIIEVAIDPDGSIYKTTIVQNSGILMFDVAAIDTLYTAGPFQPTPDEIRSVDGRVYLHWVFRRDWEQCGTFNVRMYILDKVSNNKIDDGAMVRNMKLHGRKTGIDGATAGGTIAPVSDEAAAASARAHLNMPAPDDPAAQMAANVWLNGFAHRNIKKMIGVSAAPFRSGDQVIANSAAELANVYANILSESRGAIRDYRVFSPAGYTKVFGNLPPGIDLAAGNLLMAVRVGKERFTLVLARTPEGSYKVTAFHR